MKTPRPHAELAARYMADDSLKCWARGSASEEWVELESDDSPGWYANSEYYVGHEPPAPEIIVNGWRLPAPMKEAPPLKTKYWAVGAVDVLPDMWRGTDYDKAALSAGNVFRTPEQAQQWQEFVVALRTGRLK